MSLCTNVVLVITRADGKGDFITGWKAVNQCLLNFVVHKELCVYSLAPLPYFRVSRDTALGCDYRKALRGEELVSLS